MESYNGYNTMIQSFVTALTTGEKATLTSMVAEEVNANGSVHSGSEFAGSLVAAFAVASPHTVTIDMTTIDSGKRALAVRLIHRGVLVEPYLDQQVTGDEVEWPEHLVLSFNESGQIITCHRAFGFDGPTKVEEKDVKVKPTLSRPVIEPPAGFDIAKAYAGYIEANNNHTIRDYFPGFIADTVVNNGKENTREEFTQMIEWNWSALKDVQLQTKHLLVDTERQHVAAELELTAIPVKEFHGVPADGKRIKFGEIAMYKLNGGKVEQIWVVLDLGHLRESS